MKRTKSEGKPRPDRRTKIVLAAMECFIEKGVGATRFNEIAARAGVDQPLIHYYFPNLENLYREIVDVVLASLKNSGLKGIEEGKGNSVEVLRNYVRSSFKWAKENPGYASLFLYFYYLASYSDKFLQLNKVIRDEGRDRISVVVYKGIEDGVFAKPSHMTVAETAIFIQGLMTGNTLLAVTEGGGAAFEQYAEIAVRSTFGLFNIEEKKKKGR